MLRSLVLFSGPEASDRTPSLADFITTTSGFRFSVHTARLREQLGANPCLLVYGESGAGKSALVKRFLETHFPNAARVWLAPGHLEQALDEAERARFGVAHPLIRVLDAAVTPENFLIIDAAERLTPPARVKAQQLVAQLLALNGTETPPPWRVIIVGQTEFWAMECRGRTAPRGQRALSNV